MKYKFKYHTSALDLWKLSMYGTYGSMIGVSNIIFAIAMLLLTIRFWSNVNIFVKVLLIIAINLFVIIQPIAVYYRAKKQVSIIPQDMEISFDDKGVHVATASQNSDIKWNSVKGIMKKPNMIVIYTTTKHGFIITNNMLETDKEDFYKYLISKTKK